MNTLEQEKTEKSPRRAQETDKTQRHTCFHTKESHKHNNLEVTKDPEKERKKHKNI